MSVDQPSDAFVITPPPTPALPVSGGGAFPVRRVYCVGRNYAAHAREMGHDPDREPPFFFQKNPDDLSPAAQFRLPTDRGEVHHEIELAVCLRRGGSIIDEADALDAVFGYAVSLDLTLRDVQAEAKKLGRPWALSKAFAHSGPIAPIVPAAAVGHPSSGRIALSIDGGVVQEGDLAQMIWRTPEIIATLSRAVTLAPGDVILTGTPAGVGPIAEGQRLVGEIDGLPPLHVEIVGD